MAKAPTRTRAAAPADHTQARLAALETTNAILETTIAETLRTLPDKIALAIVERLADYTERKDHDNLAARVAALETARATESGAAAAKARASDTAHGYLQQFSPYIFAGLAMLYAFMHGGGG